MDRDRRRWIKGGGLALLGSGLLSRVDRVAAMQAGGSPSLTRTLGDRAKTSKSEALLLKPRPGEEGPPAPAKADRLGLDWNKATVARLKAKLADRDIQAFLVRDHLNIIYLTGYWHIETERPQAAFMNKDDAAPWYLYPGLDRDLVTSWWFGGGWTYFDFLHADGAYPYKGTIDQGDTVDLFEFLLRGIKEHGVQGNRIGIDGELYPSELDKAKKSLLQAEQQRANAPRMEKGREQEGRDLERRMERLEQQMDRVLKALEKQGKSGKGV